MQSPKVLVLLSTFNGSKYLKEQIDSLLNQSYPNVQILIRDDGSSDNTCLIIEEYIASGAPIKLIGESVNLGPALSFFALLSSDFESEFYAFCDQDDVWLPNKIEDALRALLQEDNTTPVVYCSRVTYTNSKLERFGVSNCPHTICFENALVENIMTGCTIVMNASARNLIVKNLPNRCMMHDSWVYIMMSVFGKIIYDKAPSILYRQHETNAVGVSVGYISKWYKRYRRFLFSQRDSFRFSDQAIIFRDIFKQDLPDNILITINDFISYRSSLLRRIRGALFTKVFRQSLTDTIILRLLIMMNRY